MGGVLLATLGGAYRCGVMATREALYAAIARAPRISPEDWERGAYEVLEAAPFDYIAGGAGGELTLAANREAFSRWQLLPRMLAGRPLPSLTTSLLGERWAAPVGLAPVGVQRIAHPDAERASARAAAQLGLPFVISTASSVSMEEIADAMGEAARWFQLYWVDDEDVVDSLLARAERCGCSAIVVTLDTLTLGWRERDLRHGYLPFLAGEGVAQFASDPVFMRRLARPASEDPAAAGAEMVSLFPHLGLSWEDLRALRQRTQLPVLVKGVLAPDDARRARDAGVNGIVVSNHGGRQVDGAIAALDALGPVRGAVGDDVAVLMDGGVRRGSDVVKALALGADAVLVGRPYVYGLAAAGQEGVEQVLQLLLTDTQLTLGLIGAASVADVDERFITAPR